MKEIQTEKINIVFDKVSIEQINIISKKLGCSDSETVSKALAYYFQTIKKIKLPKQG